LTIYLLAIILNRTVLSDTKKGELHRYIIGRLTT